MGCWAAAGVCAETGTVYPPRSMLLPLYSRGTAAYEACVGWLVGGGGGTDTGAGSGAATNVERSPGRMYAGTVSELGAGGAGWGVWFTCRSATVGAGDGVCAGGV